MVCLESLMLRTLLKCIPAFSLPRSAYLPGGRCGVWETVLESAGSGDGKYSLKPSMRASLRCLYPSFVSPACYQALVLLLLASRL